MNGVATTPLSRASSGRDAELVLPVPNGCEGSEAEGFIPLTAGRPRLRVKVPPDGIEWV